MNKMVAVLLAMALLVLLSCDKENDTPGGSGMIEATEVIVSAETAGQIKALYVDKGDSVFIGDTLALIDTATAMLQLQQAEAMQEAALVKQSTDSLNISRAELNAKLAEKEYNRIKRLVASGSANQQQYDNVENAYRQAQIAVKSARAGLRATEAEVMRLSAEIALLEKKLSDCHPVAPVKGTIVETYIESGELVAPGKPMVKIAKLDTVEVKVYVPPSDLVKIKLGDTATIDPEDGQGTMLKGKVVWISSEAEFTPKNVQTKEARADLVYAVKIDIPNQKKVLKIGMPVSITIP